MSPRPAYRPKSPEEIHRNMSAIRSTGTRTEELLRSALHRLGLRFRKNVRSLPGRPDIVFLSARVVVFVDGDFWHARLLKERGVRALRHSLKTPSKSYWIHKFSSRVARDRQVTASLKARGWLVLRIWESEAKRNIARLAQMINKRVVSRLASGH
jgi:DNA mismatch endonuclease (patch repair protein)